MKVATWNVGDGHDAVKQQGLARLVKNGADVICLQECGDRQKMLDAFCDRTGWSIYYGSKHGAPSVPILWNPKTVRASGFGTREATPATHVGRAGAGPSVMKPKVWNHIRFVGGGTVLVVINGHVVPSVYLPKRRELARKHLAVLADMVEWRARLDRAVVAVGDFNMRPRNPLTKPLRKLGMTQRTKAPTHGRRTIDHVWTLDVDGSVTVLEMPSDHNAALLTVKETA